MVAYQLKQTRAQRLAYIMAEESEDGGDDTLANTFGSAGESLRDLIQAHAVILG